VFSSRITLRHRVDEHHYRYRCDGTPYVVPQGAQSCSYRSANLIVSEIRHGTGKDYMTLEVSANGQEMRIVTYKDETRTKVDSLWVMDRVN
jgi:hypothetical protein